MSENKGDKNVKIRINNDYQKLIFPLPEMDYQELKKSIKENGLWQPITVNPKGIVLDGHHRLRACQESGIEPNWIVKTFDGDLHEKLFVIDSNLKRRHLNGFQRVELALKKKPIYEELAKRKQSLGGKKKVSQKSVEPSIRTDELIAKDAMTSRDTIRKVQVILEKAEKDDLTKVRIGEKKINEVYKHIITTEIKTKNESLPQSVKDGQKHDTLVNTIYGYTTGLTEILTGWKEDKIFRLDDNLALKAETREYRFDLTKRLTELDLNTIYKFSRRSAIILNDFLKQIDDEKDSRRKKKALTSE